ncbi:MAG: GNAT family N-acetyltransferase [Anaerolineales bacterium]
MTTNWITGPISDKKRILAFLESDRLYAAYAIGDLEPELFAQCAWAAAEEEGLLRALGLRFGGLQIPALFLMGEAEGVRILLRDALHPGRAEITCRAEHLPVVGEFYTWEGEPRSMWRMVLRRRDIPPGEIACVRLDAGQAGQIRNLITLAGISGFAAAQVEQGVFFGIYEGDRIVSVAGTHVVSRKGSVAGVGNIVTHPEFRGRGYGRAAVSAVVADLIRIGIRDIVLNVRHDNAPALHLYEKLGFERSCAFHEGPASIRGELSGREGTDAKS